MSTVEFENACLEGVKKAFDFHRKFTGGLSLDYAPESFMQAHIAHSLSKIAPYVTLESDVAHTLKESLAEMRGKKPRNGRIDIVTWWKNESPRFLIEVKKLSSSKGISEDVKRLRQCLNRGGSTREGFVIVYSCAQKKETLNKRFAAAAKASNSMLSQRSDPVPFMPYWSDKQWHYEVASFRVPLL